LCEQGRNFCNKLWNALRLVKGWEVKEGEPDAVSQLAIEWMENRLNETLQQVGVLFKEFRLSEALITLYKFIWDDFCSWYLEMIKPAYGEPIESGTLQASISIFERMMVMLHPFMPFVTEEIWHQLIERQDGQACAISKYPQAQAFDASFLQRVELAKAVVSGIRDVRNNNGLKQKDPLVVFAQDSSAVQALLSAPGIKDMLVKMGVLASLNITNEEVNNGVAFLAGNDKFYVELEQQIDVEEERKRLQKELEYYQGFIKSVMGKLSNERFVNNAPADVVAMERKKLADGETKMKNLESELTKLN
jgi:valyl-tRNA synthetase